MFFATHIELLKYDCKMIDVELETEAAVNRVYDKGESIVEAKTLTCDEYSYGNFVAPHTASLEASCASMIDVISGKERIVADNVLKPSIEEFENGHLFSVIRPMEETIDGNKTVVRYLVDIDITGVEMDIFAHYG